MFQIGMRLGRALYAGASTGEPGGSMMTDALIAEHSHVERDLLSSDYRSARARGDLELALQIAFKIEARRATMELS